MFGIIDDSFVIDDDDDVDDTSSSSYSTENNSQGVLDYDETDRELRILQVQSKVIRRERKDNSTVIETVCPCFLLTTMKQKSPC